MKSLITFFIKIYQLTISPILRVLFGQGCRYTPTCSQYAVNAIQKHGILKGGSLAVKRISSCHS